MNFSSIFVALPCHSMIFFEFSNINAILGDEVAKHVNGRRGEKTRTASVLVGGNFETLGSKFRNETEGLLPSPPPKTIIKKEKDIINYETSNFHHHGLKIRLGNHAKSH